MGTVLKLALKIVDPITVIGFSLALCFLYFRIRTIKSLEALAALPPDQRKDAFTVLQAGIIPSLIKEANTDQLRAFNKYYKSRETTLRILAALATALFLAILILQSTYSDIAPPSKPPRPRIMEITCSASDGEDSSTLLKVSFAPVNDLPKSFRMLIQASTRKAPLAHIFGLSHTLGEIQVTTVSASSAELSLDRHRVPQRVYIRIIFKDYEGRIGRRSDPVLGEISQNCYG